MNEPTCLRCGRCCQYPKDGRLVDCKYLVRLKKGKTLCRIYRNRLKTPTTEGFVCGYRKDSLYDYEGCPYNTNKPILGKNWEKT